MTDPQGLGDPDAFFPLPSATLHILVALTAGEKHGYAIMGDVESLSDGAVAWDRAPGTARSSACWPTVWFS